MSDGYDANVFINCPFDDAYQPLFRALVFAIHACGLVARSALEIDDGGEARIEKITRLIGQCRYGIHDISRTDADAASGLPRMNMPFELGLFLGAKRFGSAEHKDKTCVIFDREPYRYQRFLSDISGQDVRAHGDDPGELIRAVRNALATTQPDRTVLPAGRWLIQHYMTFLEDMPTICMELRLDHDDLGHRDLAEVMITWLERNPVNAFGLSPN